MTARATLDTAHAVRLFHALSDETRLSILKRLRHGERCVCELTDVLDAAQSRLSFHLRVLKKAGLVTDRREGRWMYYTLTPMRSPTSPTSRRPWLCRCQARRAAAADFHFSWRIYQLFLMEVVAVESTESLKAVVREKYGQAALRAGGGNKSSCCGGGCGTDLADPITSNLYSAADRGDPAGGVARVARVWESDGAGRAAAG